MKHKKRQQEENDDKEDQIEQRAQENIFCHEHEK